MFRKFVPVLAWALCAGSAFGGAVGLNDYSAWVSATQSGFNIIDFSTITVSAPGYQVLNTSAGITVNSIQFVGVSGAGYELTLINGDLLAGYNFGTGNVLAGPIYPGGTIVQKITITLPAGYTSIGLDLAGLLDPNILSMILGFTLKDGAGNTITYDSGPSTVTTATNRNWTFLGATADTDIRTVEISISGTRTVNSRFVLDNFRYGVAQSQSGGGGDPEPGGETPEIGTNLMIGFGLLLLYRTRRHQLPLIGC